jgi:uncharacterized protein with HEPN domain
MYDKSLISEALENIEQSLSEILEWTANIATVNDFLTTQSGTILLNAICMKLFAVCEELKSIDKKTDKQLFAQYPAINWKEAIKMRDVIAHHYFEIDAEIVFSTLLHDIQPLLQTIKKMKIEITK